MRWRSEGYTTGWHKKSCYVPISELMPLHLLMDVQVPRSITVALRRRGIDVLTAQERGLYPDFFARIKQKLLEKRYIVTFHAYEEADEEEIEMASVRKAVIAGELIEDYPNDRRGIVASYWAGLMRNQSTWSVG